MAVYTSITKESLESFLIEFNIGTLISFDGISSGVTNTNYLITTAENKITGCFSIIRNENDLSIISFYSLLIF